MSVINLSKTYTTHEQSFSTIEFREPTGADYWTIGPISEVQPTGGGHAALFWDEDRIHAYAERLMVLPAGWGTTPSAMLAAVTLSDTMRVVKAVKGFFSEAEKSSRPQTS